MTSGILLALFGCICLAVSGLLGYLNRTSMRDLHCAQKVFLITGLVFVLIGVVTGAINVSIGIDW